MNEQRIKAKNVNANANENAEIKHWECGHIVSKSSHLRHQVKRSVNKSYWMCENVKNAKGMPFTMYGIFCSTTFPYFHSYKF